MAAVAQDYQEPYRPQIHYSPKQNWMNDPNGLFQDVDGVYHMFYQYNPYGSQWGHMSWGHATSEDMIHWSEQPVALLEENGISIFSGSAIVDYNNTSGLQNDLLYPSQPAYVLIYTGNNDTEQNQNLAYSIDGGKTFVKYAGNPVLRIPGENNFRDPKVMWYGPEEKWVMAVSLSKQQKVAFYESRDMMNWKQTGTFEVAVKDNTVWECPDLFQLTCPLTGLQRWVLIVNLNPGGYQTGSGAKYFLGTFDGKTFIPDDVTRTEDYVDYGADFYAVTSFWTKQERFNITKKYSIGWMDNWSYSSLQPTTPWRGQMSVARELKLFIYTFFNKPANETYKFFLSNVPNQDLSLSKVASDKVLNITSNTDNLATLNTKIKTFLTTNNNPELLHIIVNFTKPVGDFDFGLNVRTDFKDVKTVISVKQDSILSIDRSKCGSPSAILNDPTFSTQKDVKVEWDSHNERYAKVELVLDRMSVEAFFFSWYSMTDMIYPNADATGLELWSSDDTKVGVDSISIVILESVHEKKEVER